MLNMTFEYVGLMLLSVIMLYFQRKRNNLMQSYQMYFVILITLLVVGVSDVILVLPELDHNPKREYINLILHILNMSGGYFLSVLFVVYLLCVSSLDRKPAFHWMAAAYIPGTLEILFIVIFGLRESIAGHGAASMRDNIVLRVLLIVGVIYNLVLCFVVGMRYRKVLGMKRSLHLLTAGWGVMILEVFQYLYPQYRVLIFMSSLIMLDVLFSIQKPEEIYESSDAMKRKYLFEAVEQDENLGNPFFMVFINILDYNVLRDSLGIEDAGQFMKQLSAFLAELTHRAQVFQLEADTLVVKIPRKDDVQRDEIYKEIRERFKEPWHSGLLESMLSAAFVKLDFPAEVANADELRRVIGNMRLVQMQPGEEYPLQVLLGDDKEKSILRAIRRGLEENSFEVYYQPIYSTHEKKVVAAEALIRLKDPELGFVPVEPMITLAEREGYILQIGEIVFREVCRFYREMNLDKLGIEYVEVNLSAVQCMQHRLADEFIAIMKEYGIGTERINFEITETSAITSNVEVSRNIAQFERSGVSLSLDDYGTGYSNISYLYNMPFIFMKIDKSILWGAEENEKANIVLRNTFRMAQRLKMKVVMEGVETEEQIKKLLSLNCDYFQGYYFSKPIEGERFVEYIKNFSLPEVCR